MAKTAFSLAGIALFGSPDINAGSGGFEVPQDLEVGLETWGSVHKLPQTGTSTPKIIVQTFGVFPKPIKWEARFLGATAEARAKTLASAQVQQRVVPFVAGARSWDVVIWDFTEKIYSRYDIGYTIELHPLAERSGRVSLGLLSLNASNALYTQYTAFTAQLAAIAVLNDVRLSPLSSSLTTTTSAIFAAQPESQASFSTLLGLQTTVGSTITAASTVMASLSSSTLVADAAVYLAANTTLSTAQSYLTTLGEYTGANKSSVVMQNGGDLFTVAATQLGDWTRAFDLAAANGLTDPFLSGPVSVTIPQT